MIANRFQSSQLRQVSGYLQDLSEYKFCISPPGIGLDTHRTWEALMVGTIPIVLSSPLNSLYQDFPVVIVPSYDLLTEEILYRIYEQIVNIKSSYNFYKLCVHYWDTIIN